MKTLAELTEYMYGYQSGTASYWATRKELPKIMHYLGRLGKRGFLCGYADAKKAQKQFELGQTSGKAKR